MGQDVSAEVAGLIGDSKVYGSSENIRHGKYDFLIKKCFSEAVENEKGTHRMSFVEVTPLKSEPNPQIEGDRIDYVSPTQPGTGPLKDDGRNPNAVGSNCALKVDHDGDGAKSAGGNIKAFILGLFNQHDGQVPPAEINKTWIDLARRKPCKKGDTIGFDAAAGQPIIAQEDKGANPACGMIISCTTVAKKKRTPNLKGAYVTKLIWTCTAPIGTGVNAPDLVAKRRLEIEASQADDEAVDETPATPAAPSNGTTTVAAPPPPAPPAPPAPPPPPSGDYTPPAPWKQHTDARYWGTTPESQWYWNPSTNAVKSRAQLKVSGGV